MKKNYHMCLSLILILTAFLTAAAGFRDRETALAARIAPQILRFHVLANSDSPEDQALKLEVKTLLLNEIRAGVPEDASKEAICRYITEHSKDLENTARNYMKSRGFDYPAQVRLETCRFPRKTYGDMTFPAGTYDAVRVLLGEGMGQNFWCVLYPSLCYLDDTHAVVPEDSREVLKSLLPEDDFLALLQAGKSADPEIRGSLPRIQIRLRIADLFS